MNHDQHNPKDPLLKTGPQQQQELFREIGRLLNGRSTEEVLGVALNLFINAVRQAHATRRAAEAAYDEHVGRSKAVLMQHYDAVTDKRRSIFPFDQVIQMDTFVDKDGFRRH